MILLSNYQIISKNNYFYTVPYERLSCPHCKGLLQVRDIKHRKAIDHNGTVHIFCLRRMKCTNCGVLHIELPDLLVPHKHYTRSAIEASLSGSKHSCPAEPSTIYHWKKERAAGLFLL